MRTVKKLRSWSEVESIVSVFLGHRAEFMQKAFEKNLEPVGDLGVAVKLF